MNWLVIVLRIVHILSGAFWVGSAVFNSLFLGPAVGATAEAGQKVMAHLVAQSAPHRPRSQPPPGSRSSPGAHSIGSTSKD